MKKAIYNVMLITVIAKILGFGREILLSYYFGANGISDAYLISQTIPGTIFLLVGTGLVTAFIPVYMKVKNETGNEKADCYTNTILTAVIIFSTTVVVLVLFFAEPIVKLFASGFTGDTLEYAVLFTRIDILSLYFSAMIYVFSSYLQANGIFSVVAFIGIPNSIAIMAAIIAGAKIHIMALPIGSLLAVFSQLIILWLAMKRQGYQIKLNCHFCNSYVKETILLLLPVILGVSVNQINVLIDRTIASRLAVGGISALTYADSLIMFVQGVFSQSIATVYYPSITQHVEKNEVSKVRLLIKDALGSMIFVLIPIMIGCIILGTGIVQLLYGRGAFDEDAVDLTGIALSLYGVGIAGYGSREILTRVFYAQHDTRTPMLNATIGMILNIILDFIFARLWGVGGLALATSISCIATAGMLYIRLKKKLGDIVDLEMKKDMLKIFIASMIMGLVVRIIYINVNPKIGFWLGIPVCILAGILVYFVLVKVFSVTVFIKMQEIWKTKTGRSKVDK